MGTGMRAHQPGYKGRDKLQTIIAKGMKESKMLLLTFIHRKAVSSI